MVCGFLVEDLKQSVKYITFVVFSQRLTLVLVSGLCVSWHLDYYFFHSSWQQNLLTPHPSICCFSLAAFNMFSLY